MTDTQVPRAELFSSVDTSGSGEGSDALEGSPGWAQTDDDARHGVSSIAIVEDQEGLRHVFSLVVESLGYDAPFVASDGIEMVEAVREGRARPDLVLMDYRMPLMNGIEAARGILDLKPDTKIILISADDSIRPAAVAAGLFFVQKPCSVSSLVQAIVEVAASSSLSPSSSSSSSSSSSIRDIHPSSGGREQDEF